MASYKAIVNPFTGKLTLIRADSAFHMKDSVATQNDLPLSGNTENDVRITQDDDKMYTWGISATSGLLTDWKVIGSATSVDWSAINGKPSSTPAEIDSAVTANHTQNTDIKLDEGGANEVVVADIKDAVTKKHTQNTDTDLDATFEATFVKKLDNVNVLNDITSSGVDIEDAVTKKHTQNTDTKLDEGGASEISASELVTAVKNIMINAFRIAVNGSLSIFNMIDGIVDEYEDESGIDNINSIDEFYNSQDDYYVPRSTTADIDANTKLMLHCNGIDGSTTFTDSSLVPHTVTATGNAQIDTVSKKWGTASGLFDGSGDYLNVPSSTDFDFLVDNTSIKTIDCWIKTDSPSQHGNISDRWNSGTSQNQGRLYVNGGKILFNAYQGGTVVNMTSGAVVLTDTNWHHIVLIKVASEYGLYFDGVQVDYVNDSSEVLSNSAPLLIGSREAGAGGIGFTGWIDEFRYQNSNPFSASPNVGLTDTITVPNTEYGTSTEVFDMTLISEIFVAESQPDEARLVILEEDVDTITLNTDLKAWVSEDSGVNWHQVTLVDEGNYDINKRILIGSVALTNESDTNMVYKFTTHNLKELRIHASALSWN